MPDGPIPAWTTPLLDAAQQRAVDQWAIDSGQPGAALMERAGAGLAQTVSRVYREGRIAVVVGKGNNGGDGLVAARRLRELGREVEVLMLAAADELRGDARSNYERLPGQAPIPFTPAALEGAAVIVDAILGTGFSGRPREPLRSAIEAIDQARRDGAVVAACDVASGVDASTGEVIGPAVTADLTVTFHAAKPGHWVAPGKAHAGELVIVDIGIGEGAPVAPEIGLIDGAVLEQAPRRGRESTKFAAGAVLVCGGSLGLTGAPSLASEAAQRAGAGYVTALIPRSLNLVFEQRLLEAMSVPLPDEDGAITGAARDEVLQRCERAGALVLGPGIGRAQSTQEFVRAVATQAPIALLLDADGLFAFSGRLGDLARRDAPAVLTPHAGELGRLLERESAEIEAHRLAAVREAAATAAAVVVLKGDDTIVACPDGRAAISRGGASALATAGTGDVLSGVIGAFLSKRMEPFTAACAGVLLHASAGRLAAAEVGDEGVIARDVIELLPRARRADRTAQTRGERG